MGDHENPGQLPVQQVLRGTCDCVIQIFTNFFTIYVFLVKESITGIPTELPCLVNLDISGQLPVREVLMILSYRFLNFFHSSSVGMSEMNSLTPKT